MGTAAFLLARLAVVPLGAIDGELRGLRGRLLSVGCGHGLLERYVAEINPQVAIVGLERERGRVAAASSTQDRSPRVRVLAADVRHLDDQGSYAGALAIDVFHHLAPEAQQELARDLHQSLVTGGVCLVKDIATTPRWQYLWNRAHDRLVAGAEPIWCRSPSGMATVLEEGGFEVEDVRRLTRVGPYPHYMVRARRSG